MIFSPSVSVVAIGVVSGLCFYFINGFRRGKATQSEEDRKKLSEETRCICCLKPFVVDRGTICGECGARACRKNCSRWNSSENAWNCLFCHQRRFLQLCLRKNSKWLEIFGGLPVDYELDSHLFSTAKAQVCFTGDDHAVAGPEVGLAAGGKEDGDSLEMVRDFVEKIVEGLVGNVDETPIDRLYNHPAYDRLLERYRVLLAGALARLAISLHLSITNKPTTDTPTMAHTALRELVERAVEEARKLPGLGGSDAGRSHQASDVADQTYEDLLATAILNKVVEKYQRESVDGNSNVLHRKSSSKPKYITSEIEVGLDEGVEEGSSSLEPLSQDEYSSDCSAPQIFVRNRQEPLSLTIEERIEEVTTTYTSDEEQERSESNGLNFKKSRRVPFPEFGMDIIDPSQESSDDADNYITTSTHIDLVSPVESWEENWLFQKKKMQSHSEPVAMLVPNPSEDFRALIGDKDAEDTSDLSECSAQSDEEIEDELIEAINNVVPHQPDSQEAEEIQHLRNDASKRTEIHTTETSLVTLRNGSNLERLMDMSQSNDAIQERIYSSGNEKEQEYGTEDQKSKVERGNSLDIRLSVEDMLVFHMSDQNAPKDQSCSLHQDSTDFIAMEKQSQEGHKTTSIDEPKLIKRSQSENSHGLAKDTKLDVTIRTHSGEISQATGEVRHMSREFITLQTSSSSSDFNEVVETAETEGQLAQDIEISKDQVDSSERPVPVSASITRDIKKRDKEDLNNDGEDIVPISPPFEFKNSVGFDEDDKEKLISLGTVNLLESEEANGPHKRDLQSEDAQQEREYTEHYATATQRHMDSLKRNARVEELVKPARNNDNDNDDVPPPIPTSPLPVEELRQCREAVALARAQPAQSEALERKRNAVDIELATPPRPGTIAEREHKKWENAAPIENNPYSEENIQKRLWDRQYSIKASDELLGESCEPLRTQSTPIQVVLGANQPDFKRYERDYYINDGRTTAGERSRNSTMSITGRSESSLSHHSSLTGSELEPQELIQYVESGLVPDRKNDVKVQVLKWQQKNEEPDRNQTQTVGRKRVEAIIQMGAAGQTDSRDMKESFERTISTTVESCRKREVENVGDERSNSENEIKDNVESQESIQASDISETIVELRGASQEDSKSIVRESLETTVSTTDGAWKKLKKIIDDEKRNDENEMKDNVENRKHFNESSISETIVQISGASQRVSTDMRESFERTISTTDESCGKRELEDVSNKRRISENEINDNVESQKSIQASDISEIIVQLRGASQADSKNIKRESVETTVSTKDEAWNKLKEIIDNEKRKSKNEMKNKVESRGSFNESSISETIVQISGASQTVSKDMKESVETIVSTTDESWKKSKNEIEDTFEKRDHLRASSVLETVVQISGARHSNSEDIRESFKMGSDQNQTQTVNRRRVEAFIQIGGAGQTDSSDMIESSNTTISTTDKSWGKREDGNVVADERRNDRNKINNNVEDRESIKAFVTSDTIIQLTGSNQSDSMDIMRESFKTNVPMTDGALGKVHDVIDHERRNSESEIHEKVDNRENVNESSISKTFVQISGARQRVSKEMTKSFEKTDEWTTADGHWEKHEVIDMLDDGRTKRTNNINDSFENQDHLKASSVSETVVQIGDASRTYSKDIRESFKMESDQNQTQTLDRRRVEAYIQIGSAGETGSKAITLSEKGSDKDGINDIVENQESFEASSTSTTGKNHLNENQAAVRRINLKAYGFDNEMAENNTVANQSGKRVVNRLDLTAFGYDSGVRRTQSISQIDIKVNDNVVNEPLAVNLRTRSHLTQHSQYELSKSSQDLVHSEASGDFNMASTEEFEEVNEQSQINSGFGGMKSAKSMPNVARAELYSQNPEESNEFADSEDIIIRTYGKKFLKTLEEERLRREMIKASSTRHGFWRSEATLLTADDTDSSEAQRQHGMEEDLMTKSKSTEVLSRREMFNQTAEKTVSSNSTVEVDVPMPSVRRLAQAFNRTPPVKLDAAPRVLRPKKNTSKGRPTTPEIHIVETPRQMHSLTARSLSREFREVLRQIPNKMTSPPASHVITEHRKSHQSYSEAANSSETDDTSENVVVEPGKLINNIKFWEQLQKRS